MLKAFDEAYGKKSQAIQRASRKDSPGSQRNSDDSTLLALAPAPQLPGEGGPAKQDPPANGATGKESAPAAATPADDVPPPEPAIDPEYVRTITDSQHAPHSGGQSSTEAAPSGSSSAHTPSPGSSMSKPFDSSQEPADPKASAEFKSQTNPEMLAVDEDPVERKDFEFECQAVDDKDVLRPEEMAAYWRLMRWVQEQPKKEDLLARVRPGITFSHFFEHPNRYRGQLVKLKIRVSRATAHETEENGNSLGIERVYDLWGTTEESGYNPYALAVADLPADFPLGHGIQEDVTFVGYFFKLLAYKAHDDKTRAAPLLIGRIIWHPTVVPVFPVNTTWLGVGLIVGLIAVMLLVRFSFNMQALRRPSRLPPLHEGEAPVPIETWLERAEGEPAGDEKPPEAINPHINGDKHTNGNGNGHVFPQRLDPTEDQER